MFFRTDEQLVAEDRDEDRDVYARDGNALTLISNDAAGDDRPVLEEVSADGRRVVYSLSTDDVYVNDGGAAVELISQAIPQRLSPDGSRLIVTTDVALAPGDADSTRDVYQLALAVTPRNTAAPTISGTAAVGRTLTCSPGTWSGGAIAYAYRWNRDGAAIAGAAGATRVAGPADAGKALTCTVTATNAAGSVSATSAAVTVALAGGPGGGPGGPPAAAPTPGACAAVRTGTPAADLLVGTSTGDRLRGLAGGDVLRGLAGADCLTGGRGPDRLVGGKGARPARGRGADELAGGKGADALAGGRGADVIRARDRRAGRDGALRRRARHRRGRSRRPPARVRAKAAAVDQRGGGPYSPRSRARSSERPDLEEGEADRDRHGDGDEAPPTMSAVVLEPARTTTMPATRSTTGTSQRGWMRRMVNGVPGPQ